METAVPPVPPPAAPCPEVEAVEQVVAAEDATDEPPPTDVIWIVGKLRVVGCGD